MAPAPSPRPATSVPPNAQDTRGNSDGERIAVEGKFSTVRREYESFRKEYGPRLESDWNSITSEITFGKGTGKYAKVNSMLESLRRSMAKVRSGG